MPGKPSLFSGTDKNTASDVMHRVRRELLDVVAGHGLWFSVATIIEAILINYLVASYIPLWQRMLWGSGMLLAATARYYLSRRWAAQKNQPVVHLKRWEQWSAAVAFFNACALALLITLIDPTDSIFVFGCALLLGCHLITLSITYGLSRWIYPFYFFPIYVAQWMLIARHRDLMPVKTWVGECGEHACPWFFNYLDNLPEAALPLWLGVGLLIFIMHRTNASLHQRRLAERLAHEDIAAQQRVLLDTLALGVLVTQGDIIVDCNEPYLKMYGYKREQLIGQSTRIFMVSDEDYAESLRRNHDFYEGDKTTTLAKRKRADGSIIDVEIHLGLVAPMNPDSLVVGTYENISEHLRIVEDLRDSQERLGMAMNALQSGLWSYRASDQEFFISRRFKQVLGFDDHQELEAHQKRMFFYHEWIDEADRERIADARQAYLMQGIAFDEQYRLHLWDRVVWVRESVVAQLDSSGKPERFTGSISDTSESNVIQEKLRGSEKLHRTMVETIDCFLWYSDNDGIIYFVNERAARDMYGYEVDEMVGHNIIEFIAPDALPTETFAQISAVQHGMPVRNAEVIHLHKNGRRLYVSLSASPLFDAHGNQDGVMGMTTNITHIKKRERSFQEAVRLQRLIFDSAGEGIVIVRNSRVFRANQAFVDLIGATLGEVIARPLSTWFEDAEKWHHIEAQLVTTGSVLKIEQPIRCLDGRTLWISGTGRLTELDDQVQGMIWVFADITLQKTQEEQSWYRANHDELTDLPNRRMLQDRLDQALHRAKRESGRVGLLMLDLDGFKTINDTYGHRIGDEVLKTVSKRMLTDVRDLDTVARMGGDEFVVVLHGVEAIADIELMAQRLIECIREPMLIDDLHLIISTSIGISLFPESDESIIGLMHAADMAMYMAKANGKNTYCFADNLKPETRLKPRTSEGAQVLTLLKS